VEACEAIGGKGGLGSIVNTGFATLGAAPAVPPSRSPQDQITPLPLWAEPRGASAGWVGRKERKKTKKDAVPNKTLQMSGKIHPFVIGS
jgi:hypothetical protein